MLISSHSLTFIVPLKNLLGFAHFLRHVYLLSGRCTIVSFAGNGQCSEWHIMVSFLLECLRIENDGRPALHLVNARRACHAAVNLGFVEQEVCVKL